MLQIGAALFYYKLGQNLLQIGASAVTNWGSYYKLGQPLLQNRGGIANWGKMYYKLGQVLQIRAIITNWGIYYLKVSFYCLGCFAMSNLNSAHFTIPNSYQRF